MGLNRIEDPRFNHAAMQAPMSSSRSLPVRRSGLVFSGMLVLVWIALAFPEMPPQGLLGILWAGAGLLMVVLPPQQRLPRVWILFACGFVGLAALGFLPREWFPSSSWRADLEALGLPTGDRVFLEPLAAVEDYVGFAATALIVMYLLGHRADTTWHHALMLAFAIAAAAWTITAMAVHDPGEVFGFFPNRNHTACLLAMATFAGLGSLVHAIRAKSYWKIAVAVPAPLVTIWALFAYSESRAGLVLLAAGLLAWGLLAGRSVIRGHAGKAIVLILVAAIGAFLIGDFTAKKRLAETVTKLTPADAPAADGTISMGATEASPQGAKLDGRISIFKATAAMVANESWLGVGPGRYASVIPQYRDHIDASHQVKFVHPESDWLMMLAETGIPATISLVAGVVAVLVYSIRQARKSRARLLKSAGIVAALVLCLHGCFDVSGHRVGIAWAAALLLALTLRPSFGGDSSRTAFRPGWRAMGLVLFAAGCTLLVAHVRKQPVLPTAKARSHFEQARKIHLDDLAAYQEAVAAGLEYNPPPENDPLLPALDALSEAIRIKPLDPYLHFFQGSLALLLDDRQEAAKRAFAIQRRLDPHLIQVGIDQANSWMLTNDDETLAGWEEAMKRSFRWRDLFPDGLEVIQTYRAALHDARHSETHLALLLPLANGEPALVKEWCVAVPPKVLDREMPNLLKQEGDSGIRNGLFDIWQKRGMTDVARQFALENPSLELSPQTREEEE
jgi:O-antigen ligase